MEKEKIRVKLNGRYRLTLPEIARKHMEINSDDDIWLKPLKDGKMIVGRIKIKKEIVE